MVVTSMLVHPNRLRCGGTLTRTAHVPAVELQSPLLDHGGNVLVTQHARASSLDCGRGEFEPLSEYPSR